MPEARWEIELKKEGFSQVALHEDPPDFSYSDHSHPIDTAYVVLHGEMQVWVDGKEHVIRPDDRLDIKKHLVHSAKIGPEGCKFLIAIRV